MGKTFKDKRAYLDKQDKLERPPKFRKKNENKRKKSKQQEFEELLNNEDCIFSI